MEANMDDEKFSNSTDPLGPISEKQNHDVDEELSPSYAPEVSQEKDDEPDLEDGDDLERNKTEEYPGPLRLSLTVLALAFSIFLVALDLTIVATAIPRITDDFHSLNQVGWYGSAFFLTVASFQSTWGKVYKYFPLKTGFLVSVFVFEVGSLICGVSKNSTTLIVGRAVAGSGDAGVASGVYTIIAFSVPPKLRGAFTGLIGAVFGTASVVGPLLVSH
jgi:MFS transporter, DHA2 family, glioxin efflux transporter